MSSKKKQDFQALASDRQLAIVFSSMIQVSEAFDYGIGNPEYFVRISMTEEEADIAKENLESIKLENKSLKNKTARRLPCFKKRVIKI